MAHNCGDFAPDEQGGLTSMNLHDLITLMILLIGISGYNEIKYKIEYILKFQIHKQRSSLKNESSIQQLQPSRDAKEKLPLYFDKCHTKSSNQHIV